MRLEDSYGSSTPSLDVAPDILPAATPLSELFIFNGFSRQHVLSYEYIPQCCERNDSNVVSFGSPGISGCCQAQK